MFVISNVRILQYRMSSREVFVKLLIVDQLKLSYEMQAYLNLWFFL